MPANGRLTCRTKAHETTGRAVCQVLRARRRVTVPLARCRGRSSSASRPEWGHQWQRSATGPSATAIDPDGANPDRTTDRVGDHTFGHEFSFVDPNGDLAR